MATVPSLPAENGRFFLSPWQPEECVRGSARLLWENCIIKTNILKCLYHMNDKIMKYFGDAVCKLKTTQIKLKRKYKQYAAFSQNSCELFQFSI